MRMASSIHVCVGVEGGLAWGISLIDGSYPRSTDIFVGGVRRLTIEEAWEWKQKGPEAISKQKWPY